jgi:hypothetical protein
MRPVLAHQGGWDEMLVAAGLVLAVMGMGRLRRRREARGGNGTTGPAPAPDICAYCGAPVPPGVERCPSCGFRREAPPGPRG